MLCFALVLPIIVLGAILVWSYVDSERRRLEQEALRAALETTAVIDRELAGLVATTQVLALSPRLRNDDLEGFDRGAREVSRILGTNVVVRDRESHQVVNTRLPRGAPLPMNVDAESDQIATQTRKPVVSNLFIGGATRRPLFMVNVPVLRGDDVVYFVNLSLEPELVRAIILGQHFTKGWSVTVADRRGAVVADSSGVLAVGETLPQRFWGDLSSREGIVRGQTEARGHASDLVAFSRSQYSGWTSAVTVPGAQVVAPMRQSLIILLAVGTGILALSATLAFIFSRRIAGSVGALTRQAESLGRGGPAQQLATQVLEVNVLSGVLFKASQATERIRDLQAELFRASRLSAMGEMAASLAHELSQPLGAATNFIGAARLALRNDAPDAAANALSRLDKASQQAVRAGAILRRIRDFVGRRETEKQIVTVPELVEDAVALALVGIRDPRLRMRYDLDPAAPAVVVDRIQIQQVLFNLLRNALEAMAGDGPREITLASRATDEGKVEIAVADTGPGLGADRESLFNTFVSSKAEGMGIGLSICRTIVEAHGGRIWAENRTGGGAVFRFVVPAARKTAGADV
jgi:signal transduction histidine kinase